MTVLDRDRASAAMAVASLRNVRSTCDKTKKQLQLRSIRKLTTLFERLLARTRRKENDLHSRKQLITDVVECVLLALIGHVRRSSTYEGRDNVPMLHGLGSCNVYLCVGGVHNATLSRSSSFHWKQTYAVASAATCG